MTPRDEERMDWDWPQYPQYNDQYNQYPDEQYQSPQYNDPDRYEEKYKAFERLGEEVELVKKWEKDIQYKLEHPARVLIQLKEVSRVKLQHMELLEEIKGKGAVISKMEQDLVQIKGDSADSPQSMALTDKLKLVREAYTVILKTAENTNHHLQHTMEDLSN